jgi:putative aldouronate transport system substrate-binding protein
MNRSRLIVILSLAAAVCLLAGGAAFASGKADTSSVPDNSGGVVYDGKGPIAKAGTTITLLSINSYYSSADLATAPIVKELTKRAGITVNYQLLPPGNYADAMKPRLAAGSDLPDIVYLPDLDPTMKYIKGKLFIPINALYDKFGINLKKVYAGPYASVKPSLTAPDGQMYYVPQLGLGMNYQPAFMVNERWLAAVGLQEPTTIDEFTAMLRAFRDKDPNKNGQKDEIPLSIEKGFVRQAFGPMFGLDIVSGFQADKAGKVQFGYLLPAYKEYLTYLNLLYKEGLLDPDFATTTMDQENARFAKNVTGADFHFSWLMSQSFSSAFKDYDGKTPIVKGILPIKGPHGDRSYLGRNSITGMFGISKDSKLPDIAFKFLDLAIGDDAQVLYNWGIEGDTYTVKDGKRVYTGKDNDYLQKFGIDPVNLPLIQFTAMAEGILPKWHVDYDYAVAPYMKGVWPFVYSLDDEASVENQYMTDINTYVDEMELKFITGTEPLANIDKFTATLKNMNIDKVIAARQAQWDRYQKATK